MNVARKNVLLIAVYRAMCVAFGGMSGVTPSLAQDADPGTIVAGDGVSLSEEVRTDLERELSEVISSWINRQKRATPQAITARVVLGEKGDDVLVMIGSGYIAGDYDEIEDGMHEMTDLVRTHARKILVVYEFAFYSMVAMSLSTFLRTLARRVNLRPRILFFRFRVAAPSRACLFPRATVSIGRLATKHGQRSAH